MLVSRFDIRSASNFPLMRKTGTFNKGISVDEKELVNLIRHKLFKYFLKSFSLFSSWGQRRNMSSLEANRVPFVVTDKAIWIKKTLACVLNSKAKTSCEDLLRLICPH